jgi:hypothetical protein
MDHWKLRALYATRGQQTMMGAIVLAIIGHIPRRRPYIRGLAEIDSTGVIWAKLYPKSVLIPRKVPLCKVQDYTDELNRLADLCKFDDRERNELFTEARKWIERDHRAKSEILQ